jgi:ADP-ribose pyrophosphatase YjhB (NUDIX family)
MHYRITPRALIQLDDKILFIAYQDITGKTFYALPGGQQEIGVDLRTTLQREIQEETGLEVEVGNVILVNEFIDHEPQVEVWAGGIHQIEIIFSCHLLGENQKVEATKPDFGSKGFAWVDKNDLQAYKVYPNSDLVDLVQNRSVHYRLDQK